MLHQALSPKFSGEVTREAERIVATALRLIGDPARVGGYLCVMRKNTSPEDAPLIVVRVGAIPNVDKIGKYFRFAQEKARRLAQHPGHRSSRESRDPANDRWGGAIAGDEFIFSFSGLPEHWDEACMLALARAMMKIDLDVMKNIAAENTPVFEALMALNGIPT